jgi:predicted PurR-regulated permease PerM
MRPERIYVSLCGSPTRLVMILVLAIGAVLVTNWLGVFDLLIFAGSFSVVLYPVRKRLAERVPPSAASAIIAAAVLVAVFAAGYAILSVLDRNLGLIGDLVDSIQSWLTDPSVGTPIPGIPLSDLPVGDWLNQAEAAFQLYWSGVMGNLSGIFVRVVFFSLMVFLALWKGDSIWAVLRSLAAPDCRPQVDRLTRVATDTVYAL